MESGTGTFVQWCLQKFLTGEARLEFKNTTLASRSGPDQFCARGNSVNFVDEDYCEIYLSTNLFNGQKLNEN